MPTYILAYFKGALLKNTAVTGSIGPLYYE